MPAWNPRADPGRRAEVDLTGAKPVSRGAWYADPYGRARERWWDGTKWTREIRGEPTGESVPARRPRSYQLTRERSDLVRSASGRSTRTPSMDVPATPVASPTAAVEPSGHPSWAEAPEPEKREPSADGSEFPIGIEALVGQKSWLRPIGRKATRRFELVSAGGHRAGLLYLSVPTQLAIIECAQGEWRLRRPNRQGWELIIETPDGHKVGRYSGRHWLAGGFLALNNGVRVDLRRSRLGWKLQTSDTAELIADIRGHGPASRSVVLWELPAELSQPHLIVLPACAVLMLGTLSPLPGQADDTTAGLTARRRASR